MCEMPTSIAKPTSNPYKEGADSYQIYSEKLWSDNYLEAVACGISRVQQRGHATAGDSNIFKF